MKGNIIGGFLLFFVFAFHAQAATLYMDPTRAEISRGDTIKMSVRLDTDENECVNVVDAVIHYDDTIYPVDISRGSSILSMWVQEPTIDTQAHTISFAGGIPNGYCGRIAGDPRLTNVVVDLLFQSPGFVVGAGEATSTADVSFNDQTQILLNDGFGTQAPLRLMGAQLQLSKKASSSVTNQWGDIVTNDNINPEGFSISLTRIPDKNGLYYVLFNTTDKQSGIDHYEVIEEPPENAGLFTWGQESAPWQEAHSPYKLKDQTLQSTIRVKAIDKAGNEYIATYVPPENIREAPTYGNIMIFILIAAAAFLLLLIVLLLIFFLRRRKKNRLYTAIEEQEDDN